MVDLSNEKYKDDLSGIRQHIINLVGNDDKSMLITGATGLLGSFLTDAIILHNRSAISGSIQLDIMTRNREKAVKRFQFTKEDRVNILEQDIGRGFPNEREYDYIIHLASNASPAMYGREPYETIETNILGAVFLSKYLKEHKNTRAIIASTMEVYGQIEKDKICEEDYGTLDFNSLRAGYPESKRVAELLLRSAAEEYGTRCIIARLGYLYGPTMQDSDNKIVAELIRNAAQRQPVVLKTAGEQRRTYCYVSDAASAIIFLLSKGTDGETYNIANRESETSIRELAELFCKVYDLELSIQDGFVVRMNTNIVLDTSKLEKLGWKAEVSLVNGVSRSVDIWRE